MDVDFGDFGSGNGSGGGGGGGGDDITSELLQKFSCMNTTDREVLIQQFKGLLGADCSESNAEFWLDMNNWNLQAAVCAYFDFESQNSQLNQQLMLKLPSMQFATDATFNDKMPPNSPFIYRCLITNSGDEPWPLGCTLRFCGGTQMSNEERVLLPSLNPGQSAEVRLSMMSPNECGGHQCQWRPATITGQFFGETIFVIVNVFNDIDLQTVTQRLSAAHLADNNHGGTPVSSSVPSSLSVNQSSDQSITANTSSNASVPTVDPRSIAVVAPSVTVDMYQQRQYSISTGGDGNNTTSLSSPMPMSTVTPIVIPPNSLRLNQYNFPLTRSVPPMLLAGGGGCSGGGGGGTNTNMFMNTTGQNNDNHHTNNAGANVQVSTSSLLTAAVSAALATNNTAAAAAAAATTTTTAAAATTIPHSFNSSSLTSSAASNTFDMIELPINHQNHQHQLQQQFDQHQQQSTHDHNNTVDDSAMS